MQTSRFAGKPYVPVTPTRLLVEKRYDFKGGLDTYSSNEALEPQYSPYLRNCRNTSRNSVATRKGSGFYTIPVGQTQDTTQTSVTGAGDATVGLVNWQAAKLVPGTTGRLTQMDLNLKTASGTGVLIVEVHSDNAGSPGTLIGSSSISGVTSTYQYRTARFLEGPQLSSGATYWVVLYLQDNGLGTFSWSSTTAATTAKSSIDGGTTWAATTYALNVKSYISADSPVLGLTRFYRSTGTKTTVLAHGTTHYTVDDGTGVLTAFKTGLQPATDYYYAFAQDTMYYVNGVDTPRQYNLTTDTTVAGNPDVAKLVALHKNRLFFVSATDPTKIVFSDEGDYGTYQSTSFLYVPAPRSTDPITGIVSFQDNLYIFTRKKKWVLFGNTLSNFILREAAGKQGAISQNSIVVYDNYIYFCNETGPFKFNGSSDHALYRRIIGDYAAIPDKTKISGVVWNDNYYIFCPAASSSANNQALVYDTLFDAWFFDTNAYYRKAVVLNGPGDSNQLVLGSSVSGTAYFAETQNSDMGKAIDFEYWTKYESFGDPSRQKRVKRFYPQFKASDTGFNITISHDVDFNGAPTSILQPLGSAGAIWGSGIVWGSFTWGRPGLVTPRLTISGKFRYIQRRFSRVGVDTPVEILGFEDYWVPSRAR